MTRTSVTKTHKRRGYIVTHHEQRTRNAHEHHFVIHDLGAMYLPKARHLARMFIPFRAPNGTFRKITSIKSGVSGIRSVWYQLEVRYQKGERSE